MWSREPVTTEPINPTNDKSHLKENNSHLKGKKKSHQNTKKSHQNLQEGEETEELTKGRRNKRELTTEIEEIS